MLPIAGEYPLIQSKLHSGKRLVRLALPPKYLTGWHLHFHECAIEWNDIAGKMFIQGVVNRENV